VDSHICVLGKLTCVMTAIVAAAPVNSVKQMVADKMLQTLEQFGIDVFRLENRTFGFMSTSDFSAVATGALVPVAHWNALDVVERLVDRPEIKLMRLVLDESDDMITSTTDEPSERTNKEAHIRRLVSHPKVNCVVSVSATQLGWLVFLDANNMRVKPALSPSSEDLQRVVYRGLDALEQLHAGDAVVTIPPESRVGY
jgi:hypothetical protein